MSKKTFSIEMQMTRFKVSFLSCQLLDGLFFVDNVSEDSTDGVFDLLIYFILLAIIKHKSMK